MIDFCLTKDFGRRVIIKRCFTLVGVLLVAIVFMAGCASQPSKPVMTFETIGTKGTTVFVTLTTSPEGVSVGDLADRLKDDWQNHLIGNQIHVMVFDNKDAPQRWLELWPTLSSLSDQEWAKEQARIFPHHIANYDRNVTTGFHQVEILSRDINGNVVQTIKF